MKSHEPVNKYFKQFVENMEQFCVLITQIIAKQEKKNNFNNLSFLF